MLSSLSLFSPLATLPQSRIEILSHLIPSRCLHALAQQQSHAREALLFPSLPPDGWGGTGRVKYFIILLAVEILRVTSSLFLQSPFVCMLEAKEGHKNSFQTCPGECELLCFSSFCATFNGQVLCYTVHWNSL